MGYRISAIGALLLAAFSTAASAQMVYKCVAKGKPKVYQSAPCASNATIERITEYRYVQSAHRPSERQQAQQARQPAQSSVVSLVQTIRNVAEPSQCDATKADRDAWEGQVGLNRNYETLQWWNDRVRNACK